jgi:ribosomal-protein-alanine N-acetyltransferase
VRLRRAVTADVGSVHEIERAAFSDPWSRGSFASLVSDPRALFAVAVAPGGAAPADGAHGAGAVLGYAVATFVVEQAELANLATAPAARRRGVGGLLLDEVIREAVTRGTRELFLEVRESNRAARALYASRGFVQVGRRRGYYRRPVEDALVLRLGLDE